MAGLLGRGRQSLHLGYGLRPSKVPWGCGARPVAQGQAQMSSRCCPVVRGRPARRYAGQDPPGEGHMAWTGTRRVEGCESGCSNLVTP